MSYENRLNGCDLLPDTDSNSNSNSDLEYELTWPTLVDNQVHWVPYVSLDPEHEIIDRFSSIVRIHEPPITKKCAPLSKNKVLF